jgi:type I restriction enzyme S subunit
MEDIRLNGRIFTDSIQHISLVAVKGSLFQAKSVIISTSDTIGEHALILVPSLANQRFTYLTTNPHFKKLLNIKYFFYLCDILDKWCKNNLSIGYFS